MLALERHREILAVLNDQGSVRVNELAEKFGVTEETIRRDLDKLESDGQLVRSHGGALPAMGSNGKETPYWWREIAHEVEKAAIAREAISRIQEGDRIILDASTSAWHIAKRLSDTPLSVVTNSTQVASVLARHSSIHVTMLGGDLARQSLSFVGPTTEEQLRRYHVDKVFLSCAGVDLDRGLSDATEAQAHVRRVMMECADRKILLADHSKIGVRSLAHFADLNALDELVTDSKAPAEALDRIRELNVEVSVVPTS